MNSQLTSADQAHLQRALELAEGGRGRVSPNPLVGAVVVRGGEVVGEGFHAELGGLHAERAALADCAERGEEPAGATMYVTLEPCAHEGRQPPCVEAILEAGITRVVIASDDPSEKAAGRGPGILRDGGVEVVFAAGAEAASARLLNQAFRKHARTGLPLVTLKLAMSLDGRTSTAPGDSPWISGEASRTRVHRWRAESDAIAVGIGTVLADDPLLTARIPDARQPIRVVFDSEARIPLDSQLLASLDQSPVLVVAAPDADPARATASQGGRRRASSRERCHPCRPRRLRPRQPRPPRNHQPLPRGRPHSCSRISLSGPGRRIPHLHRPRPPWSSRCGSSRGWRGGGGPPRRGGASSPEHRGGCRRDRTRAPICPRLDPGAGRRGCPRDRQVQGVVTCSLD